MEGVVGSNWGSLGGVEVSRDSTTSERLLEGCGTWVETHGKKLQAEDGRSATKVKISEMSRCCTLVSWLMCQRWFGGKSHEVKW